MTSAYDLAFPTSVPAPLPEPAAPQQVPRPWGFWGTLGWALLAALASLIATVVFIAVWMATHALQLPDIKDGAFVTYASLIATLPPLIVLVLAIKVRKWRLADYLALTAPRPRDIALGIGAFVLLIVAFEAVAVIFGMDDGSAATDDTYRAARLSGVLPMLWLEVVVVAPLSEELFFRGFLHRGWAASRLGVVGTVFLTAVLWALLHQQYNWLGIAVIFCMGLTLGWLRQRTGSLVLTMVLHALNNLFSMVFIAVKLEWLS
jgi:membrane protease YdiL (CAAX protease family)